MSLARPQKHLDSYKTLASTTIRSTRPSHRKSLLRSCPRMALLLAILAAGIALPIFPLAPARGAAGGESTTSENQVYKLVALDKIKLHVLEWRPAKDEVFTWTAINHDYKIGASGMVALPLVGEIQAAGLTTSELADAIANRMRGRLNLSIVPDVTVDIVAYRPVYVAGDVERPGEILFTPGMTVLQGLSLGGGLRRSSEIVPRIAREVISTTGDIDALLHERAMLVARLARLEAELDSDSAVVIPQIEPSKKSGADGRLIETYLEQEQKVFAGRRKARETSLNALTDLKQYLEQEVGSLSQQLVMHDRQIKLMRSELVGISDLAQQRLATQPRLLGLQRNIVNLESERLRIQTALARAQQEAKRAGISMIEHDNTRTSEILKELQTTAFRLDSVNLRVSVLQRLMMDSMASSSAPISGIGIRPAEPVFTIVRQVGAATVSTNASESTRLEAGDVLKVERSIEMGGFGRSHSLRDLGKAARAPAMSAAQ